MTQVFVCHPRQIYQAELNSRRVVSWKIWPCGRQKKQKNVGPPTWTESLKSLEVPDHNTLSTAVVNTKFHLFRRPRLITSKMITTDQ